MDSFFGGMSFTYLSVAVSMLAIGTPTPVGALFLGVVLTGTIGLILGRIDP